MLPHHQETMDRLGELMHKDPTVRAVVIGGSIAKGLEKPDSDVDFWAIVTDEEYARREAAHDYAYLNFEIATYEHGYVDGKFVDLAFLEDAADHGSEPARSAFTGAFVLWSNVEGLEPLMKRIVAYPEAERDTKMRAFYAQATIMQFFMHEAIKRDDPFLMNWAAMNVLFYSARLLLAHNRVLYPSQKRLLETVAKAPELPADYMELVKVLAKTPDLPSAQAVLKSVNDWRDWGIDWNTALGQYLEDAELNWRTGHCPLSDS